MEPNNEVGGGDQSSPPKCSSFGSWSGASSPRESGGAPDEPPHQHPEHDQDAGDQQPPTEMELDDMDVAPHLRSNAVVLDRPPSSSAGAQAASNAGAI
jgi:hypothetical protein